MLQTLLQSRFAAASLSGVLLGLSFAPFPFPFLAWIAFVPLFGVWDARADGRAAFLDAYVAFLITFAVAFQWPLFHEFTETAILSLPPLLIIPMWMALPFAVAHPIRRLLGRSRGAACLFASYILMEYGLRAGPLAFPWPLVGHTQSEWYPINQLAALGGVPLLTLIVLASNGCVWAISRRVRPQVRLLCAAALLTFAVFVNPTVPDTARARAADVQDRDGVRIGGIQPSLAPDSWADLEDTTRVSHLLSLSRRLIHRSDPSPDLIVWPETAIPPRPSTTLYTTQIQAFVDSTDIPILAGAITTGSEDGAAYRNSALLIVPRGAILSYEKVNLVPFAERVPFAGLLPHLERLAIPAGGVQGYEPGKNRAIFEIPEYRFGVLICFETLFSSAARTYARGGVDALIAITQDGWWGNSFGYRQHLAFNRLRSIETGLPMLQVAVSGVSALIYADGRTRELAGWMEPAQWVVDMPPAASAAVYVRLGDWVTILAAMVAVVLAVVYFIRNSGTSERRHPRR